MFHLVVAMSYNAALIKTITAIAKKPKNGPSIPDFKHNAIRPIAKALPKKYNKRGFIWFVLIKVKES